MPSSLIDYAIAVGLLLVAFATIIGFVSSFSSSMQTETRLATLQYKAVSLLGLAERDYAFNASISGIGLAEHIADGVPPRDVSYISIAALQRLSANRYSDVNEGYDFRLRIVDETNETVYSYGRLPSGMDVAVMQKPVLFEYSSGIKHGTFVVEVW